MIYAGIDAGSRAIKIVLIKSDSLEMVASGVEDQGIRQEALASSLLDRILEEMNRSRDEVKEIVATGYGRNLVKFADRRVTEITCHARGVYHLLPETRTIIEIGGQDSKVVRMNGSGTVHDFNMNDRCAAGTGRFLEVVAQRLEMRLEELGEFVHRNGSSAAISSMCVVFAETEIIGLLSSGLEPEDILSGVQDAVAKRVAAMAGRSIVGPIVFTGGVAMIPGMKKALEKSLGTSVLTAPHPQLTGALGAALVAANSSR